MTKVQHTYIRCGNKIYVGDTADQWRMLHDFETEKRAKRWQRDQEKKRPGSVMVGQPPQKMLEQGRALGQLVAAELARKNEIHRLIREQEADRRRQDYHVAGMGTPAFNKKLASKIIAHRTQAEQHTPRAYVAPDHDGSSFLRERSKKRVTSRVARNTRATYGAS